MHGKTSKFLAPALAETNEKRLSFARTRAQTPGNISAAKNDDRIPRQEIEKPSPANLLLEIFSALQQRAATRTEYK